MWRIKLGHPATGAVGSTIYATAAQVTEAGLTITLDEWGGNKTATWTGLTGGAQDRSRVWIEVLDADGVTYKPVFSGVLTKRPSAANGAREAVGDKYLRLKELPVRMASTGDIYNSDVQGGGSPVMNDTTSAPTSVDVGAEMRRVVSDEALGDLPHLVVTAASAPDAGVQGKRLYNGESVAAALDGLVSFKAGWGWTILPNDKLYVGPPPAAVTTVNAALEGVKIELRDVVSEGLINAVRWIYNLPNGKQIVYESQDASVGTLGRSALTRYIDQRSAAAIIENAPANYFYFDSGADATEQVLPPEGVALLRDGMAGGLPVAVANKHGLRLAEQADWVEIRFVSSATGTTLFSPDGDVNVPDSNQDKRYYWRKWAARLPVGYEIGVSVPSGGLAALLELNPKRLRRDLLDDAAKDLYRIPAQHAGTASVLGIQPPAGKVTVKRPSLPDITEKCVGTRYLIQFPMRTEYLIGEPDVSADAQVLRVLIDRKDAKAVDTAVNAIAGPT